MIRDRRNQSPLADVAGSDLAQIGAVARSETNHGGGHAGGETMNIEADPVGYKLMSRQLSALREAELNSAERLSRHGFWLRASTIALAIIAVLALAMALSVARFVMVPATAGIVVGLILGPIGDRGARRAIPSAITYTLLVIALFGGLVAVAALLMPVIQVVSAALPSAANRLDTLMGMLKDWTDAINALKSSIFGAPRLASQSGAAEDQASAIEIATATMAYVTPAVSQLVIFLFTLILFLAGRADLKAAITLAWKERDRRLAALRTLAGIESRLTDYFLVVTVINLALGSVVAAAFWLIGVPGWMSWGLIAFVLNFLPVVGPLMMKVALLAFGLLVQPDLLAGAAPLAVFLVISLIEANFVTPRVVGERITMNPLIVFLSVVFWTWLWGFAGAFLAMPLLAIASVILSAPKATTQLPA